MERRAMRRVSIDWGDIQDVDSAPLQREEEQPRHVFRDVAVVASILALACLVAGDAAAGHVARHSPLGASRRQHVEGPRRSLVDIHGHRHAMRPFDAKDDANQEGSHSEPDEGGVIQQPHFAAGASSPYEEALNEAAHDLDEAEETPFRYGEPCEIEGAYSDVSSPCTFIAVNGDGTYKVQNVRNLQLVPSIKSEFVHRYTPIHDGSDAICTVRNGKAFITACTISRGFQNLEGSFFYEVEFDEYVDNEMRVSIVELPFGSVERIIEPGMALEKGKKYFLPSEN
ncbi:hypothetical protein THAOC_36654 [Thalassiosira oceanica]|uniref:Uncharacterized protein n=1 Tax=Thalassiosira oceanica TaxID=159749 RepID=K0R1J5_THAOC|nr:hypothetical protein THAOC_36654 [Thalassiosira oceanica]|eukprot:EJK44779.1 hypothetical protein THAOC_36654 [Thalassiosira oceanica]